MSKTIVIAGDVMWDHNLVLQPTAPRRFAEGLPHTTMKRRRGGAWFLQEIVTRWRAPIPSPAISGMPKRTGPCRASPSGRCTPRRTKAGSRSRADPPAPGCQPPEEDRAPTAADECPCRPRPGGAGRLTWVSECRRSGGRAAIREGARRAPSF